MPKDTSAARKAGTPIPTDNDGFAVGRPISAASKGGKLPDFGERRRLFFLASHSTSWDLVETSEGWRLVPTLKRLIVAPGVNWTKAPPKEGGPLDSSNLEAKARTRLGAYVLTDQDEYLQEFDGANGTKGHFLKWERIRLYTDGLWETSFDADGYDLWRWSLVSSGRVEAPRDSVISQIRTRLKKARNRATQTPHLAVAQEAKATAEARLAGLEEAVKALAGLRTKPGRAAKSVEAHDEEVSS